MMIPSPSRFGPRVGLLFRLAAPMIAFYFVQNAMGLASLAMVGRLGPASLAALGAGNTAFLMLMALLYGLDTGVQALVSRSAGAGAVQLAGRRIADGLTVAVPLGLAVVAAAIALGPPLLRLVTPHPEVARAAAEFLAWVSPGLFALALAMVINAYWVASGRPGRAFAVMAIVAPLQILISWPLILGVGTFAGLGVAGAGAALAVAAGAGLAINLLLVARKRVPIGRPAGEGAAAIVRIGWPVSLQQSLVQLGALIAIGIVARLGVAEVAVLNVMAALSLVPVLASTGVGAAAATLVGQALGRGEPRDARRWGWQAGWAGAVVMLPLAAAALAWPRAIAGAFIHDQATLELAVWPLRLMGLGLSIEAFGRVLGFGLRGAGATRAATLIPFVCQSLIELPMIWVVGVALHGGLLGVALVQLAAKVLEASVTAAVWASGRWSHVDVPGLSPREPDPSTELQGAARVAVMGGAGAGKSTLARQAGAALGVPVVHLDRLVYGPGWARAPLDEARGRLADETSRPRWVVEGVYPELADLILPQADLVIWLDQPWPVRLLRCWRKVRTHSGRERGDRPEGCEERFDWRYLRTVLSFGGWSSALEARLRRAAPNAQILRLKGDRQAARLFAPLAPRPIVVAPAAA